MRIKPGGGLRRGLAGGLLAIGLAGPATADEPTIVQIASGGSHNCARDDTGQVWCWGSNERGQLGDDTLTNRLTPVPVQGLNDAVDISVAQSHSCAVRADGHVLCWGENSRGQLGDNTLTDRRTPVEVRRIGNAV